MNIKPLILIVCLLTAASCGRRDNKTYYLNGSPVPNCSSNGLDPNMLCRVAKLTSRSTVTPMGAHVWTEAGVALTDAELVAIDDGMSRTFTKSQCRGYGQPMGNALKHSDYTVAIFTAEPDSDGNPAFRAPCAQYCGTIYDKGGYILVAGQSVAIGMPYGDVIALPDPDINRLGWTSNGAEFETEHNVLAWYDGDLYTATMTHGTGAGHPIFSCP